MKKHLILIAAVLIALPALGFSDTFSFRVGYFFPRADNSKGSLWKTQFENLTLTRTDYQATIFGISYEHSFNPYLSVEVGADTYSKTKSGFYNDWVGYSLTDGDFAFPVSEFQGSFSLIQTFSVSILPIQVSLKVTPLGRRGGFIPYFGGGAALNIWSVRIYGDMVDFSDPRPHYPVGDVTIYPVYIVDARDSTKLNVSYQAFAGVMIPVGVRMTIDGGFKYIIGKGTLKKIQDFKPMDFDGFEITLGINYWF